MIKSTCPILILQNDFKPLQIVNGKKTHWEDGNDMSMLDKSQYLFSTKYRIPHGPLDRHQT